MTQTATGSGTSSSPFLTRYASKRTPGPEIPGYYSPKIAMWVVIENGVEAPMIDQSRELVELVTKTHAQQENDDETNFAAVAELATKTDARPEQDDASAYSCLEMATKTEAQLEHDDTSSDVTGLFL
jgi:hypothetical protein